MSVLFPYLCRLQVLVVGLGWEPHGLWESKHTLSEVNPIHTDLYRITWSLSYLDGHVVDVQAEGDSLVEGELRLPSAVNVHRLLGLDVTLLMVYTRLDHTVTDRLRRHVQNTRSTTWLKRSLYTCISCMRLRLSPLPR